MEKDLKSSPHQENSEQFYETANLYDLDPRIIIQLKDNGAHTEVCSTGISCCPTSCH